MYNITIRFTGKLLESPGQMLMFDEADMGCDVSPENVLESKCFLSGELMLCFMSVRSIMIVPLDNIIC